VTQAEPTKPRPEEAVDRRLFKALGRPLRAWALAILNDRVAGPNEIAKELGVPAATPSPLPNVGSS
jgi:hypothetical protein